MVHYVEKKLHFMTHGACAPKAIRQLSGSGMNNRLGAVRHNGARKIHGWRVRNDTYQSTRENGACKSGRLVARRRYPEGFV